jgi:hypothetical protein
MGIAHVFADLGFIEAARPQPDRVIMRYTISGDFRDVISFDAACPHIDWGISKPFCVSYI